MVFIMRFVVGCDFGEFKRYYNKTVGNLGSAEEYWVAKDVSHLIVWRENNEIAGHAIWHESNTDEHKKGDPRDKEDKEMLKSLLGEKSNFVELHEVWLAKKHRGRGHGKKFFKFFEEFVRTTDHDAIIYYAYHPAAIAICRQRGYEEAYGLEAKGLEGKLETMYIFYLKL
jgi:GNAT superfamily N-acetyltransferase